MSSRTVPRFALTALLVAALAAPAVAQESPPEAPMPRAKAGNRIEIELYENYDREVKSTKIGDLVMRELKGVDHVAYVRFALRLPSGSFDRAARWTTADTPARSSATTSRTSPGIRR